MGINKAGAPTGTSSGMGLQLSQVLLLGTLAVLLMDAGDKVLTLRFIRFCNYCKHHDGFKCLSGMQNCWKFNVLSDNRTCTTDVYYYSDRLSGRYLYRYTKLSCRACDEGMFQVFHDLLRETFCCSREDNCNDGFANLDVSTLLREDEKVQKEVNEN